MDKAYKYAKYAILHFKLDTCFCFAPIRIGLLLIGYFNLFIALLSLIGTADGGITPPLMETQDTILEEDHVSMSAGIFAYACELSFSVVLLCAIHRNDIALLKVYIYFLLATVVTSVLIYSMVITKVALLTKLLIIGNIVFNCYVVILVRSAIVEIKERQNIQKNDHVVLYSVATLSHEDDKKVIEIKPITDTNKHEKDLKIEYHNEAPKIVEEKIIEETIKIQNDKTGEQSKDNKVGILSKKDIKIGVLSKKGIKNDDKSKINDKTGEKSNIDKTGEKSNIIDKTSEKSKKDDKTSEQPKRDVKIGEQSKISDKTDQTHAKLETVNENPKEQSVHKI